MTDESWEYTLNLNLNHLLGNEKSTTTHASTRDGRIIAISSVEGKMRTETVSHYVATKHAINGLVKRSPRGWANRRNC